MAVVKKILKTAIFVIVEIFSIFTIFYCLSQRNESYSAWIAIGVGVVGLVVVNLIHIVLHELGHLIGGKLGGFTLLSFRIGFINICRENGKLKVRFQKLGNNYGGVCQMLPPKSGDIEKNFKRYVQGGIAMSIAMTLALGLLIFLRYFVTMSELPFLFFACAFPLLFPTLLLNLSTDAKVTGMTDGMFLKSLKDKNVEGICAIKTLNLQSFFVGGVRPKDVPIEIVEDFPLLPNSNINKIVALSNQMACYLDRNEEKKVIEISDAIAQNFNSAPSIYHSQLLADVFYVEATIKKDIERARKIYLQIADELSKSVDISVLRIMICYNSLVLQDMQKAKELAKFKDRLFDSAPIKGIAIMERDLIDKLTVE